MGIIEDQNAYILAHQYNFMPEDDGKYEPFEIDDFIKVDRLAHRPSSNNCMIKFDLRGLENPE